jgi:sulfatase maturation enzyme AslB (radical SAM superfamily)
MTPGPAPDCLIMAKPAGPRCNLACAYCYYLAKAGLFPGDGPETVLALRAKAGHGRLFVHA